MKTPFVSTLLAALVMFLGQGALAGDYVEPGRFGTEFLMTTGNMQVGGIYVSDSFEAALDFAGQWGTGGNSPAKSDSDYGAEVRLGKRFNIGDFNYIVLGLDGSTNAGSSGGVSIAGTYNVGPYVAVERHFSGTHIMLNAYVLPVNYFHSVGNDGNGNKVNTNSVEVFYEGGVGIAYLF